MTVELRANMVMTADGKDASAELQRVSRDLGEAKVQVLLTAEAEKKLRASQKDMTQSTAEFRNELAALIVKQVEAQRVSQAAQRSYDEFQRSLGKVTNSAGQMRAATANLGQQINDVTQGMALGTPVATIFAQQAGQVAFALQGMGGAAGSVGAFLGGPWGVALTAAAVVLAPFVAKLFEGETASKAVTEATKRQKEALEEYNRIVGIGAESEEKKVERQYNLAKASLAAADATRVKIAAELDAAIAERKVTAIRAGAVGPRGETAALGLPVQDFEVAALQNASADNEKKRADSQKQLNAGDAYYARKRIAEATDAAAAANGKFARTEAALLDQRIKGLISQKQYEDGYRKALDHKSAALQGIKDATKAEAAALRDAKREAKEFAAAMERIAQVPGKNLSWIQSELRKVNDGSNGAPIGSIAGRPLPLVEDVYAKERADTGLAASVAAAEARLPAARKAGQEQARSFLERVVQNAPEIGRLIGGGLGSAIGAIGQLGFGTKGRNGITSDYTGIGAQLSTALTDVFGQRASRFAGLVGQAAGGAATGSVISGIGDALGIKNSKTGAQIGGALGGIAAGFGIPGGEIIGSILGGLVGNLFAKSGSTTVSSTGGKISQSGSGNASVQKATGGLGNTISDALQAVADQLGGEIGNFSVSIGKRGDSFRVDRSGRGKIRGSTVKATDSESEALSLAIADAIRDGGIKTKSPRVQAVLQQYANDINKALTEALKVKGLEDLISDRQNPFASAFRTLEEQLKKRVDVAEQYGFDLVEIERINGEDRAAALKETLASATGSIRDLLNDLQFGSRATGSPTERLAGLTAERDRLGALAKAGDQDAIDAFASIIQQIDDLQQETFGKTAGFATGRADSVALLNDLVKTTEDRINAAADAARAGTDTTNNKLTEANATLDDIANAAYLTSQGIGGLLNLMAQLTASQLKSGSTGQYARIS